MHRGIRDVSDHHNTTSNILCDNAMTSEKRSNRNGCPKINAEKRRRREKEEERDNEDRNDNH